MIVLGAAVAGLTLHIEANEMAKKYGDVLSELGADRILEMCLTEARGICEILLRNDGHYNGRAEITSRRPLSTRHRANYGQQMLFISVPNSIVS